MRTGRLVCALAMLERTLGLAQDPSATPPNGHDVPLRAMLSVGMDVYPW